MSRQAATAPLPYSSSRPPQGHQFRVRHTLRSAGSEIDSPRTVRHFQKSSSREKPPASALSRGVWLARGGHSSAGLGALVSYAPPRTMLVPVLVPVEQRNGAQRVANERNALPRKLA